MPPPNTEQLLLLSHQIRETDHALAVARRRSRWSNIAMLLGPLLGLVLYAMAWVPLIPKRVLIAIYIPAIPIAVLFGVASYYYKRNPGYPSINERGGKSFISAGNLELKVAQQRDARKLLLANVDTPPKVRRVTYKEDAYSDIDILRGESKNYRSVNNFLQGIIIIGSLAATGASGIATEVPVLRWVTLGLTFTVGIASGFMGYFKYKERSFYLQQTADAIESEWEAVEIGVGRYRNMPESEALAEFVEEVHRLKSEQKKRQQNLEQPPDVRNADD
ncbi:SLATT domain-containing protein [Actinoplanes sp. TFC3]|uniref:SLATT domain-containing protein n=1 Tax=Actinoplanes sp. TFC3 TaxID=1710355 RepID=UPI00191C16E8|nr:SLATT domain-containing protein [Actinoplanes sp. TFC3]